MTNEYQIEENLIEQLKELKYNYRPDIIDRKTLELNFKTKFEALNRVRLSESEFLRLPLIRTRHKGNFVPFFYHMTP